MSYAVVKAILRHYGVTPDAHEDSLAQSLRIIFPLEKSLADHVRRNATSLTDAATADEQIRFFQHQRARRSYIRLADHLMRVHGEVRVRVVDAFALDHASREFLDTAARVSGWSVDLAFSPSSEAIRHQPFPAERAVLTAIASGDPAAHVDDLCAWAFDYVNAGDAWTAIALGRILQDVERSPRVWNLLALAHAMADRTIEAEFYYDKWAASGTPIDSVRALYGAAMLAIRHHPAGLRDMDIGIDRLERAHTILRTLSQEQRRADDVVFDEVFNRNGYALTLFRRGRVQEALDLLEWGIGMLRETGEKIAIHRSVLLYNLAQCHKQLGDIPAAISTYQRIFDVDPYMPEYHLEAAKCHAQIGDYSSAAAECRTAIELDPTLSVAWSLLGVYRGELGESPGAAFAHVEAARLAPDEAKHVLDAAYELILAREYARAEHLLASLPSADLDLEGVERFAALAAEIALAQGDAARACQILKESLSRFPGSAALQQNHDALVRNGSAV